MSDGGGLKIELGGGKYPRGGGYVNVDVCPGPGVDVVCDFETLHPGGSGCLPFADDSADAVYSSHCFEHVANLHGLLWETARVGRVGAAVEVRVPHWLQSMALCAGHRHTISERQVRHWCEEFVSDWWRGSPKRLRLLHVEYIDGEAIGEARGLFPQMSLDQLRRFVPGCCHEIRFHLENIRNEG